MPAPVFFRDDCYKGIGISKGLARGVQVMMEGVDLTQEGMGLGAIAVRSNGYTYFSQNSEATWIDSQNMLLDYVIDTVHLSSRKGVAYPLITRIRELGVVLYRLLPSFQRVMLWAGVKILRILGVKTTFAPVPPLARARFHFKFDGNRVEVCCNFCAKNEDIDEIFIMNELGAGFFDFGWEAGRLTKPPSGWEVLEDKLRLPFLYSSNKRLRYTLSDIIVNQELPFKVCWGREQIEDLCWAGFTIQINPAASSISDITCQYAVIFEDTDN